MNETTSTAADPLATCRRASCLVSAALCGPTGYCTACTLIERTEARRIEEAGAHATATNNLALHHLVTAAILGNAEARARIFSARSLEEIDTSPRSDDGAIARIFTP